MDFTEAEQDKYKKAHKIGVYFLKERQPDPGADNIKQSRLTLAYGHPDFWFGLPDNIKKIIGCFTNSGRCLIYDGDKITEII